MILKGKIVDCFRIDKGCLLQITTDNNIIASEELQELHDAKNGVKLELSKWCENRSLNANAYFHTLVHQIAEKSKIGNDECKRLMNLEYGTPKRLDEHTLFAFKVPKGANVQEVCEYAKFIKSVKDNEVDVDVYLVYKETHTLDSKEMSRLIEGVVSVAKELGIETKTPEEIANLVSLWEAK